MHAGVCMCVSVVCILILSEDVNKRISGPSERISIDFVSPLKNNSRECIFMVRVQGAITKRNSVKSCVVWTMV